MEPRGTQFYKQLHRVNNFHLQRDRTLHGEARHEPPTVDDLIECLGDQRFFCLGCYEPIAHNFTLDHIIPVSKGGRHLLYNIQFLCPRCNTRKNAKLNWKRPGPPPKGRLLPPEPPPEPPTLKDW